MTYTDTTTAAVLLATSAVMSARFIWLPFRYGPDRAIRSWWDHPATLLAWAVAAMAVGLALTGYGKPENRPWLALAGITVFAVRVGYWIYWHSRPPRFVDWDPELPTGAKIPPRRDDPTVWLRDEHPPTDSER